MLRVLISFDEGDMTFPEEDLPAVSDATHAVVAQAKGAGVWIFGGGLVGHTEAVVVEDDGSVSPGAAPPGQRHLGGFSILEVGSREEAHEWARRLAVACRCPQRVREIMYDPES